MYISKIYVYIKDIKLNRKIYLHKYVNITCYKGPLLYLSHFIWQILQGSWSTVLQWPKTIPLFTTLIWMHLIIFLFLFFCTNSFFRVTNPWRGIRIELHKLLRQKAWSYVHSFHQHNYIMTSKYVYYLVMEEIKQGFLEMTSNQLV